MTKKTVHIVPHSHWDREWYFTIEDSNILLIENMDYLIHLLEENPHYYSYVMDGQMSVVEEYLRIRPDNRERLKNLITNKRIFVGPWYTQTDSLLVHKEAVIRNLLYGSRMAEDMGHNMNIGYLPDIFGQNAYLPSMFKGFGLGYSILQRGVYSEQLDNDLHFMWKSPDGESIPTNLMLFGYGPGKFLSADPTYYEEKLQPIVEKLENHNKHTDQILLPSGGDQVLVRDHFPSTIQQLNQQDEDRDYILSDYEHFMEQAWSEEPFDTVIEGELTATEHSRIHQTIRSQRYDIKQLNTNVEHKLLHLLEPIAVMASTLGFRYPQEWLDTMWKDLFDVHAHDSIGGCNSDDTNSDIMIRLRKIDRKADGLLNIIKKQVTQAVANELGEEQILVLFNTMPQVWDGQLTTTIFTKDPAFTITTIKGEPLDSTVLDQEYISGGKKIVVTADGDQEVEIPGYYRSEMLVTVTDMPALGYATYLIQEGVSSSYRLAAATETVISNSFLQLEWTDKGTISLTNQSTGSTIENLLCFEERADAGDSYDFSPLPGDSPIYLEDGALIDVQRSPEVEKLTVSHTTAVPHTLEERQKQQATTPCTIITTFELRKTENFVRVHHEVTNQAKDHRLRVLLQSPGTPPTTSFADQGFSLVEHAVNNPHLSEWKERGYKEAPVSIHPLESIAGIESDKGTFTVMTKGMKEYEVLDTGQMAFTLFRSVGLLGRDNLTWRPGRASGINNKVVYTPDAQMQQCMTFDYAISFDSSSASPTVLFNRLYQFNEHNASYQKQSLNSFEERLDRFEIPYPVETLNSQYSLLQVHTTSLLSVCKQSYDQDGIILRWFNPLQEPATLSLSNYNQSISVTNLNEKVKEKVDRVTIPPKGYQTIKL